MYKLEGQQNQPTREPAQKESTIRTMKSDVAEFLKKTKPSLITIITKEAERGEKPEILGKKPGLLNKYLISAILLLLLGGAGYLLYSFFLNEEPLVITKIIPPPALFATEKSRTVNISAGDKAAIRRGLNDSADERERNGTIKRILFKIIERSGEEHFVTTEEIFSALDILPPPELTQFLDKNFMAAIYYQNEGPRIIFSVKTARPERTEETMLKWEVSMQRDILPLFLKERVETKLIPFEDRSFRNIDWRYLKLDNIKDIGVGYTIFKSRNYLVITTSREAMETAISRLFSTD